jgi:hypothetical protein
VSPRWGLKKCQLLTTLFVALFFTLFALGGSDLTSRFCLGSLSFAGPSVIMGPVWDMATISHAIVASVMCEE